MSDEKKNGNCTENLHAILQELIVRCSEFRRTARMRT